jgi:Arc/MetJ family transcription regulator
MWMILSYYIHSENHAQSNAMRAEVDVDGNLIAEAMAITGFPTKRATVEEALRRLIRQHHQRAAITDLAGIGWEGNPNPPGSTQAYRRPR